MHAWGLQRAASYKGPTLSCVHGNTQGAVENLPQRKLQWLYFSSSPFRTGEQIFVKIFLKWRRTTWTMVEFSVNNALRYLRQTIVFTTKHFWPLPCIYPAANRDDWRYCTGCVRPQEISRFTHDENSPILLQLLWRLLVARDSNDEWITTMTNYQMQSIDFWRCCRTMMFLPTVMTTMCSNLRANINHVCIRGRTFVKSTLFDRCPVCHVGTLRPNGWMHQDETWHGGRP